ncbi:hypothetical protein QBC39DRAFT_386950 [Podospora conica]|nr:hypothetical protein QBC39DRAFT_386950 [Schizothecium conicum]
MVSLEEMRASNGQIATSLPPGLVAVFAGATSGIGETSLRQFVKHAVRPKVFFLGRSQESGDRITTELKDLNSEGQYTFISCDLSLMRNIDEVCRQIEEKEAKINLLFITIGTLISGKDTSEGLYYPTAVTYFARVRLMQNLIPLMRGAPSLRRVVTVFAGTKEGKVNLDDVQARNTSMLSLRGHVASLLTLSLMAIARDAPEVGFVHNFPGAVKSHLGDGLSGRGIKVMMALYRVVEPFVTTPVDEAGERQVFFATSARFRGCGEGMDGVPAKDGESARAVDGLQGKSGVYSVGSDGEPASKQAVALLKKMEEDGVLDKAWSYTKSELTRITGSAGLE